MRSDQWANSVTIDGRPIGVWDTLAGGAAEAEDTKHIPGATRRQISLGGRTTFENVTLTKWLDRGADWDYLRYLHANRCGKAEVSVAQQPLDDDENPYGDPIVYTGKLQRVAPPDTDSTSSDVSMWEIVISTEGSVG